MLDLTSNRHEKLPLVAGSHQKLWREKAPQSRLEGLFHAVILEIQLRLKAQQSASLEVVLAHEIFETARGQSVLSG